MIRDRPVLFLDLYTVPNSDVVDLKSTLDIGRFTVDLLPRRRQLEVEIPLTNKIESSVNVKPFPAIQSDHCGSIETILGSVLS